MSESPSLEEGLKKTPRRYPKVNEEECIVWGALGIALRISRWLGVAPLQFTRRGGVWVARVSPLMVLYGYVLAVALALLIFSGLILDLNEPSNKSIRVSSQVATTVWLMDMIIVFVISTLGVTLAPKRMRHLIEHVKFINEIIAGLDNGTSQGHKSQSQSEEKWRCVAVYLSTFGAGLVNAMDIISFRNDALYEDKEVTIVYLYAFYNVQSLITILIEMLFVLEALLAHTALRRANRLLEGAANMLELNKKYKNTVKADPLADNYFISTGILPAREMNSCIDSLNKTNFAEAYTINTNVNQTLRLVNLSYGSICDVIRKIDKENGMILLLLLMSLLVHLVVTPYYLISYIMDEDIGIGSVILQLIWCAYHIIRMVMIVEPGHRTLQEMDVTQVMVAKLVSQSSLTGQLATELDLFQKQISLNRVVYAPMGMCELTRPLIASILGGVTTYVVIIVQFK